MASSSRFHFFPRWRSSALAGLVAVVFAWTGGLAAAEDLYRWVPIGRLVQEGETIASSLGCQFEPEQLLLIQNLNRRSLEDLQESDFIIVPNRWDGSPLDHSPLPFRLQGAATIPKLLLIDLAIQAFGAYEKGELLRWGAVCSGRRELPTPTGAYHLIFRQRDRISSFNPSWYMDWYFNFDNVDGLALHAGFLRGRPVSHGCVRLVHEDAIWLYHWGEERRRPPQTPTLQVGTPVLVQSQFQFGSRPPWLQFGRSPFLPSIPPPPSSILRTLSRQAAVHAESSPGSDTSRSR